MVSLVRHGVHCASVVHIAARWCTRPPYAIEMVHKGASVNPHTHMQRRSAVSMVTNETRRWNYPFEIENLDNRINNDSREYGENDRIPDKVILIIGPESYSELFRQVLTEI